ncbi:hypothetical protein Tco_0926359 [Tanacetum coccineum]|uniref:Uncharacterized protein n=1 Tax=Tanacetum coccineum TaxID=301880 RepID=A0ABQ5D9K5_9ASTR
MCMRREQERKADEVKISEARLLATPKEEHRAQESAYSESRAISPRRQRRSRSPRHNPSVFTRLRRERSRSPTASMIQEESLKVPENYSESEDSGRWDWKSKLEGKKVQCRRCCLSNLWLDESFFKGKRLGSNQERKKFPQAGDTKKGRHRQEFQKGGGFRSQHKTEKRPDRFTLLTKTPKEILALEKGKFKTPPPMTTLVENRNANKFCEFRTEEVGIIQINATSRSKLGFASKRETWRTLSGEAEAM